MRGLPFALFFVAAAIGLFFADSYYGSFGIDYLNFASPLDLLFTWLANINQLFFILVLLIATAFLFIIASVVILAVLLVTLAAICLLIASLLVMIFLGRTGFERLRLRALALLQAARKTADNSTIYRIRYRVALEALEEEEQEEIAGRFRKSRKQVKTLVANSAKWPIAAIKWLWSSAKLAGKWSQGEFTVDGRLRPWKDLRFLRNQAVIILAGTLLLSALFVLARTVGEYEASLILDDVRTAAVTTEEDNSIVEGDTSDNGQNPPKEAGQDSSNSEEDRGTRRDGTGRLAYAIGLVGHALEANDRSKKVFPFIIPTSNLAALAPCKGLDPSKKFKQRKYVRATIRQESGSGGPVELPGCLIYVGATETAQFLVRAEDVIEEARGTPEAGLAEGDKPETELGQEQKCELVTTIGIFPSGGASMEAEGGAACEEEDCSGTDLSDIRGFAEIMQSHREAGRIPAKILLIGGTDSEPIDNCCFRSNVGLAQARANWVWVQSRDSEWAEGVHWMRLPGGPQWPGIRANQRDRSVAVHVCWRRARHTGAPVAGN